MKHSLYMSLAAGLAFTISSCSNWLDVQPKTEVKQDKMFETESGFKDALVGCYMLMGDASLYGRELTYTFLEVLAQQYEFVNTFNPYQNVKLYSYSTSNVESMINGIWSKQYKVIANLNAILEYIEDEKKILHPVNYANIKAQALGLRAFLHFDLLRMFGWGDLVNTPSNLDKLCIPYVTRYSKETTKQSTVREVLQYIHADLAVAEDLLAYNDVYHQKTQDEDYELPNDDGFYDTPRGFFNYYAARATQARVYMWEGKYEAALERASFFTKSPSPISWVNLDRSVINATQTTRDLSFTTEHIFSLDIHNMYESLKDYVEQFKTQSGINVSENNKYFFHTGARADELFEITAGGGNDVRYNYLYDQVDRQHYLFLKLKEEPETQSASKNKMPMIRKPEMYYYAAECYNRLNEPKKAIQLLNEVRLARGLDIKDNLPETLTKDAIEQEITKEWRKEYIGEGQMFYYYKRLGLIIPNATAEGDKAFILPLPRTEVDLGGREDYKNDAEL
ncbi:MULTISPECIES: RagB/SusD family nutrient uptake outer membrane protein [Odoribacteraceae]|uniref:RagB/SusD family nutrient uptake outer membrane protein n=1 Tax=Odoribacteraceae TaxID=1853231 RepID=UPI000E4A0D30|nr:MULTISPECIES: RagB/SusD family nutrient uptake outer membrane protein [Odoribacteraceae]MCQ4874470.1 RagB/SusD family nutrient uptake outer membrane protein [Butyricimonas paravirosa]RHR75456.1 RagB/SusD family nutrient uptake outer membrane protein [Odoribacter sp. AF15-53]